MGYRIAGPGDGTLTARAVFSRVRQTGADCDASMKTLLKIPILLLAVTAATTHAEEAAPATYQGVEPIAWSRRVADSEWQRRGATLVRGGSEKARWEYTSGLFSHALLMLAREMNDEDLAKRAAAVSVSFVNPDGGIETYRKEDFNIDMILPGRVLLSVIEEKPDEVLGKAAEALRSQLRDQPRTSDGGFWHKQRYPWQMWLDGLYMGSPFLAQYGKVFREPEAFDEAVRQILLMDRHAHDKKTGLYHHAWDEKREQSWADPLTGCSPCFWGRSVGWYAMAIVDVLDHLPPTHPGVDQVNEVLHRLADGVARHQDPATGLWWQVLDQPGREGNYLESSASSMLVYAIAKGIHRGYLDRARFLPVAVRGYEGLVRHRLRVDEAGGTHLTHVCEVAGLGYTSSKGRPRDGTFEYYVSEPVIENDLKGIGPFILAGIEMQRLAANAVVAPAVRGWDDLERILSGIREPQFPARDFPITRYGAQPGEEAGDAIRAAIDECHRSGGGRVVIPSGEWRTGPIRLRSGVNLHVSKGATLRFSTRPEDYPAVPTRWEGIECVNHCALIHADGETRIAITGQGTLDGQADASNWWSWNLKQPKPARQQAARDRLIAMGESGVPVAERVFGMGSFLRPNFIQIQRSREILIEGVTLLRSPMWVIHPVLSQHITVRKVTVSSHGPNNDGCDPESCRGVKIEDCVFDTGDDCIAIKSGRNNDGRRVGVASENIVIRRCVMKDGHGGVVLGSEISGNVRNVFVEDCEMDSPNLDRALRFKSNARRGGILENVFLRNVRVGRVAEAVLTIDLVYEEGAQGPHRPVVRNVRMDRVTSRSSPRVLWVKGFEGAVIEGIRITDSVFSGVEFSDVVEHAGSISFERSSIVPAVSSKGRNSVPAPVSKP